MPAASPAPLDDLGTISPGDPGFDPNWNSGQPYSKSLVVTVAPQGGDKLPIEQAAQGGPAPATPHDLDVMARTMIGEDNNPEGWAAIGHVINNRAMSDGYPASAADVALQRIKGTQQFTAWADRRGALRGIPTSDPAYQQAYKIAQGVMSGTIPDPTNGAVNYLNPELQVQNGAAIPAWASGRSDGLRIGQHVFFPPPGGPAVPDYTAAIMGSGSAKAAAAAPAPAAPAHGEEAVPDYTAAILGTGGETPSAPAQPSPSAAEAAKSQYGSTEVPGVLTNSPIDSTAAAIAKNVATGAIKGAADIPGVFGNTENLGGYLAARGTSLITGNPLQQVQAEQQSRYDAFRAQQNATVAASPAGRLLASVFGDKATNALSSSLPSGADIAAPILARTGEYTPDSALGRDVQAGVETAIGGGLAGPSGLAPRALAASALMGAAGNRVSETTGEPLAGMAASLAVPGALAAGSRGVNALAGTIQPETAALARTAMQKFGIPLGIGNISESPATRFASSVANRLPLSGAGSDLAAQQGAFNRAVSNTIGENAPKITASVMAAAKTRIGGEFDRVAQGTTIQFDQKLAGDLMKPLTDASSVLPQAEVAPLTKQVDNILQTVGPNGEISGDSYQALTRKGTPLDRAMNSSDPNVAHYAGQIRDALDDALERHAPPDLLAALQQARRQYRNLKTIEPLAAKATTGDIAPALLMSRVNQNTGNALAYGGGGDLGDLARIGQKFLKEMPSSGTAERAGTMAGISALTRPVIGGAIGAMGLKGLESYMPSMSPAAAAAAASTVPLTLMAGRIIGNALRSPARAADVVNRSLGLPTQGSPLANRLFGASVPYLLQAPSRNALATQP